MPLDSVKNFAYSTVATAPSPASSGTSLVVQTGDGAKFPTVPFNATVWPAGSQPTVANAEIVRVTAVSTDTLTIVRAQESSSARSIGVGDQIAATITAKMITDILNTMIPPSPKWATGQSNGGTAGQIWTGYGYSCDPGGLSGSNAGYVVLHLGSASSGLTTRIYKIPVDNNSYCRFLGNSVQPVWSGRGFGGNIGLAVVGSNVFVTFYDTTNSAFRVYRYDLSLGTETLMTNGATVPSNNSSFAFSDGTNLYIWSGSGDVYYKYSISGTTLTYVTSITYTGISSNPPWCDGTSVYAIVSGVVKKWGLAGGSATSGNTIGTSQADSVMGLAGFATSYLDVGYFDNFGGLLATNPPASVSTYISFAPIGKP